MHIIKRELKKLNKILGVLPNQKWNSNTPWKRCLYNQSLYPGICRSTYILNPRIEHYVLGISQGQSQFLYHTFTFSDAEANVYSLKDNQHERECSKYCWYLIQLCPPPLSHLSPLLHFQAFWLTSLLSWIFRAIYK